MTDERTRGDERKIAVFIDLENLVLGVHDAKYKRFDVNLVLDRLLEKGKIVVKRAYADWRRFEEYTRPFHECAVEMIDIPGHRISGKNSADIHMVVDAMDLSASKEHLDTFAVASGDSDFSPLVSKLKENDKYVIGIGVKNSTSELLRDNCDEFIYYEDLIRQPTAARLPVTAVPGGPNEKQAECFALLVDAIHALIREGKEVIWGSMAKQTMKRKRPSFNESYYGYNSLSQLLEDAARHGVISFTKDGKTGAYQITGVAEVGQGG